MREPRAAQGVPPAAWEALEARLRKLPGMVVAFSGGVDSTVLVAAAAEVLGRARVLAVLADSPSLARSERREAEAMARRMRVELAVVQPRELEDPRYVANTGDRCFWCKEALFQAAEPLARARGWVLAYGENADDDPADRPGSRSARARGVRAPLREAGWGKALVRAWARARGLPVADKPAMPCLASRIPVGVPVTAGSLARVEQVEAELRKLGFRILRARHLAEDRLRLEFGADELPRARRMEAELRRVGEGAGYREVVVDPRGYLGRQEAREVLDTVARQVTGSPDASHPDPR